MTVIRRFVVSGLILVGNTSPSLPQSPEIGICKGRNGGGYGWWGQDLIA